MDKEVDNLIHRLRLMVGQDGFTDADVLRAAGATIAVLQVRVDELKDELRRLQGVVCDEDCDSIERILKP